MSNTKRTKIETQIGREREKKKGKRKNKNKSREKKRHFTKLVHKWHPKFCFKIIKFKITFKNLKNHKKNVSNKSKKKSREKVRGVLAQ